MAKLDITAAQIQSTVNMITSSAAASEWNTDTKYPSAKAVLGREHPVGSILITSSSYTTADAKHPNNSIGGTWELFDKEYQVKFDDTITWTSTKATLTGFATRSGHTIQLTLALTVTSDISAVQLGQINPGSIGGIYGIDHPNPLSFNKAADFTFAHAVYTNGTTVESCPIRYSLSSSGYITISEILNANKQLPKDTKIYINISVPMDYVDMDNSFCDKFYWKRTA